jgi:hypothetical protein
VRGGDDERDSDEEVTVYHQFAHEIHRERMTALERQADLWRMTSARRPASRRRLGLLTLHRRPAHLDPSVGLHAHECR